MGVLRKREDSTIALLRGPLIMLMAMTGLVVIFAGNAVVRFHIRRVTPRVHRNLVEKMMHLVRRRSGEKKPKGGRGQA